jgi:hypothetical protein
LLNVQNNLIVEAHFRGLSHKVVQRLQHFLHHCIELWEILVTATNLLDNVPALVDSDSGTALLLSRFACINVLLVQDTPDQRVQNLKNLFIQSGSVVLHKFLQEVFKERRVI